MGSFVEHLREKRCAHTAVVAKLERSRSRIPNSLFLVLEALPDQVVYLDVTKRVLAAENAIPIHCDGKHGVLRLLRYVRQKYGHDPYIVFFVDRDLDDFLPPGNPTDEFLYVTDDYSIENDFVGPASFRCILNDILCFDADESEISECIVEFDRAFMAFATSCVPLMAWAILIRLNGGAVNFNNINYTEIFDVSSPKIPVRKSQALKKFIAACAADEPVPRLFTARPVIKALTSKSVSQFIRGKYLLWFFLRYIDDLKKELRAQKVAGERSRFINANIDRDNIFQLLSARIQRSSSLDAFLLHVKSKQLPPAN